MIFIHPADNLRFVHVLFIRYLVHFPQNTVLLIFYYSSFIIHTFFTVVRYSLVISWNPFSKIPDLKGGRKKKRVYDLQSLHHLDNDDFQTFIIDCFVFSFTKWCRLSKVNEPWLNLSHQNNLFSSPEPEKCNATHPLQ